MLQTTIQVDGQVIGPGQPTFIVAEISANHLHSLERCLEIIEAAKEAGADAVKTQTYTADTLTIDCSEPPFQINDGAWGGKCLHELYKEAFTPWEWHFEMQRKANELGLIFFSTPFDGTAVDYLMEMNVPAYKVASFECIDIGFLKKVGATGKPVILSTGMATMAEIEEAVHTLISAGCQELALLKCTSAYPASPSEMDLRTIPHLASTFSVPVGLSDHTLTTAVPIASVAMGANIIEKHFTLSRDDKGPDAFFSLEPNEFAEMVKAVRTVEQALGGVRYGPTERERDSIIFRRSLFVVEDVAAGEVFTTENVRSIRPGMGLHPRYLPHIIGRKASKAIHRGTPVAWELIGG